MQTGHGHGDMDPRETTRAYQVATLWLPLTVVLLGVWLALGPFLWGYADAGGIPSRVAEVTRLRGLAPVAERASATMVNDVASGLALVVLGALSLRPGKVLVRWLAAGVGAWLLFAPLVLWAPSPAAFLNDTLVGILVVAFTLLVPKMPGMTLVMQPGPEVPPGWSYNPSAWLQRAPMIALGWIGFFLSRYLAAYQLGYTEAALDPFFGVGTMTILDSDVSLAFPVSDAGLGATAIAFEALMGYMGGTSRWRTMPWMVTFFGILVIPLGVAHVVLVILQPVAVGTWCTVCLATAFAMLLMIPLALDEVVAMVQLVRRRVREGQRPWDVFWKGDTVEGGGPDDRSPSWPVPLREAGAAGLWGVSVPWTLAVSAVLGVWLMVAPAALGLVGPAADAHHLTGALVVTVSVIATAELARAGRLVNAAAGLWIAVVPWLLSGAPSSARWLGIAVGAALVVLALPRGPVRERYGDAERLIR